MNRVFFDTETELWTVNNITDLEGGTCELVRGNANGLYNIILPYIGDNEEDSGILIQDAALNQIAKNADYTEFYKGIEDFKASCADLFEETVLISGVKLTAPFDQSPQGDSLRLDAATEQIVSWLKLLQSQVDSLANATGLITFTPRLVSDVETVASFAVTTESTDTALLDFDADNAIVNYVSNAKFNTSSVAYFTNTDGLDHTVYLNVYTVDESDNETLFLTFDATIPKKSEAYLVTDDYIDTITDAPRNIRFKLVSTSASKVTMDSFVMKIIATNPE